MRKVWGQIADWCIERKSRIKLIWNDADTQKNGLLNEGVVVGQTWDGPPLALKSAGEPVHFQNCTLGGVDFQELEASEWTLKKCDLRGARLDNCILDETDSGLDVDAMKLVSEGVNALRSEGRSFLVITHYQRLLDHIKPDVVHIMADGRIVKSGGPELALEVENNGYADILAEVS